MAQERLTMRKIAEVLRLKWECGLSNRAVARSCSISYVVVCVVNDQANRTPSSLLSKRSGNALGRIVRSGARSSVCRV